ncbi:uncharacterized protein LOC143143581 [Ptiloglossa arizonensis]|uniref:uncharacterized protein LOC143143581 n=1 Tax=Ptiloglossa arizonensis TaxID=3350558 RepID=UPI003FA17D34
MVHREEGSINPLSRSVNARHVIQLATKAKEYHRLDSSSDINEGKRATSFETARSIVTVFTMSRKKVWNSIVRRKKKNHLDLAGRDESDSGSVSPLLRRVSTFPRRGSQHRHTMDPEMSALNEYDPNHLFVK